MAETKRVCERVGARMVGVMKRHRLLSDENHRLRAALMDIALRAHTGSAHEYARVALMNAGYTVKPRTPVSPDKPLDNVRSSR